MPTYAYRCDTHGDFERWRPIREPSETCPCPECSESSAKVFTPPRLSVVATPTSAQSSALETLTREKRWDESMPAYERLRANGVQPPTIDSAPALEKRAETALEVEMGQPMDASALRGAVAAAEDLTGVETASKVR